MIRKFASGILVVVLLVSGIAVAEGFAYTTNGVNIRKAPDIESEILGTYGKGEAIYVKNVIYTVDGRRWIQTEYKGKDAYISDKYLTFEDPEQEEVYNIALVMATTGKVNVREYASIEAPVLTEIQENELVDIYALYPNEDGRVWAETFVLDREGYSEYGYISTKYLESEYDLNQYGYRMRITGGRVNVRADANINSADIGTLTRGTVVNVWCYVFSSDNRVWAATFDEETGDYIGFVSCKYLEKAD